MFSKYKSCLIVCIILYLSGPLLAQDPGEDACDKRFFGHQFGVIHDPDPPENELQTNSSPLEIKPDKNTYILESPAFSYPIYKINKDATYYQDTDVVYCLKSKRMGDVLGIGGRRVVFATHVYTKNPKNCRLVHKKCHNGNDKAEGD